MYHAGDSLVYDGQAALLRGLGVSVVLLPVNGRDYFRERRGIVGNMDATEAAGLAAEAGVELAVPMHHEAVPGNTASAGSFADLVHQADPAISVLIPGRGMRVIWTAQR